MYPDPIPKEWNTLPLDHGHSMDYVEYGNPDGEPVLFFHGGPGQGSEDKKARFFDPEKYRIILFNQRGCNAADAERPIEDVLAHNTTPDLISDITLLRETLGIQKPMHLMGFSWGSTLAMAYTASHPEHVASMTLGGIYTGTPEADAYTHLGRNILQMGDATPSYLHESFERLEALIPEISTGDVRGAIRHIYDQLLQPTGSEALVRTLLEWHTATYFVPAVPEDMWNEIKASLANEDLETTRRNLLKQYHYHAHDNFLGGFAKDGRSAIENITQALPKVPTHIVHGANDAICEPADARWLAERIGVHAVITQDGHSTSHPENAAALVGALDAMATRKTAITPQAVRESQKENRATGL